MWCFEQMGWEDKEMEGKEGNGRKGNRTEVMGRGGREGKRSEGMGRKGPSTLKQLVERFRWNSPQPGLTSDLCIDIHQYT